MYFTSRTFEADGSGKPLIHFQETSHLLDCLELAETIVFGPAATHPALPVHVLDCLEQSKPSASGAVVSHRAPLQKS